MSLDDPAFWLGTLFTALATAFGVVLAFALERTVERRRQDAAAYWMARHWARAMVRLNHDGLGISAVRAIIYGRTAPKRPQVQMALAEIDPRVATWWSRATECLVEAEDSFLPGSLTSKRTRAWAERIDQELERASGNWPMRPIRIDRLISSLSDPPKLSHAATRSARGRVPMRAVPQ
jgi:predicted outer membrane lipoprotein